jgi:NADH:ubiquinone oxidoreductase subunit H
VPHLYGCYPGICLTTEDKAWKNLSQGSLRDTVIIAGWSSNSGYSLLGDLRALAQTISYEVRLAFILLHFGMELSSISTVSSVGSRSLHCTKAVYTVKLFLKMGENIARNM